MTNNKGFRERIPQMPARLLRGFGLGVILWMASIVADLDAASVTTFAGTGVKGSAGDGAAATQAQLSNPFAIGRGPDNSLYICDVDNQRIRRVTSDGNISTYAGSGQRGYNGDGGAATAAMLNEPYEMAWDKSGNLYFVERLNHLVRRVDRRSGEISTVAGNGNVGFSGDEGLAKWARFNQPHSLAFDLEDNLYICDVLNHRIRRIEMKTGIISTWSGTGEKKTAPDGAPIRNSALHGPRALAFAPDGTCWLALREGNALLQLDTVKGTIHRIAGNGKSGFSGNGGPAREAILAGPKGVSIGADGNVYLADTESHSIRYVDVKRRTIELLVGNGRLGDGPDGTDPHSCQLARVHGVFVDRDGSVFIGDSENHRVRVWRK